MGYAWPGRAADGDGIARQVGLRNRGEDAVLFISHVNEFDIPVAAEGVDDGIESVTHNSVTALNTGLMKHFPESICDFGHLAPLMSARLGCSLVSVQPKEFSIPASNARFEGGS